MKATRLFALLAALAAHAIRVVTGRRAAKGCGEPAASTAADGSESSEKGKIVITIVYDNNAGREDLTPAWGFACVVEGLEKTILFDTGGDGRILLANMRKLGIDPKEIDIVVLSHIHGDHTGGLGSFLRARGGLPVYVPSGFPESFKQQVRSLGGEPMEADGSVSVCPHARTTGTLGKAAIEEHGLCVQASDRWVLITGCAHPGIAELAARARDLTAGRRLLAMGGFHMGAYSEAQIQSVIERFEALGVVEVIPCHCTGRKARELFKRRFGQRCSLAGVGGSRHMTMAPGFGPQAERDSRDS